MNTQADRIFTKFGGVDNLTRALKKLGKPRHRYTVEAWGRAKGDAGTGGTIPNHNWPDILKAAEIAGVRLTAADMEG